MRIQTPSTPKASLPRKAPALVDCLDEVDARFRALRTFIELLGWCSEMSSIGHVNAGTVGETSSLMMTELLELETALIRLQSIVKPEGRE